MSSLIKGNSTSNSVRIPQPVQPVSTSVANQIDTQLRIIDYRNAKYQGFIQPFSRRRHGLGMLIDDNYSFILAEWRENQIQGPFFIVYPDQSILYGTMRNNKITDVTCYHVLSNQYTMVLNSNSNTLIMDLRGSHSILTFKIDPKILEQHTLNSILTMDIENNSAHNHRNMGLELVKQDLYKHPEERVAIIQKSLNISKIPDHLKNYQSFIFSNFTSRNDPNHQDQQDLIEIIHSRDEYSLEFKTPGQTLFIKILDRKSLTKSMGCYNKCQKSFQFYKKNQHIANTAEEFFNVNGNMDSISYDILPFARPAQCIKQRYNVHKRSLTFVNLYANVQSIYKIKALLSKVHLLTERYVMSKYAQVQLQNSRIMTEQPLEFERPEPSQSQVKLPYNNRDYHLSEVQQEIYEAVNRKKSNQHGFTRTLNQSPYYQPSSQQKGFSFETPSPTYLKTNKSMQNLSSPTLNKSRRYQPDLGLSRQGALMPRNTPYKNLASPNKNHIYYPEQNNRLGKSTKKSLSYSNLIGHTPMKKTPTAYDKREKKISSTATKKFTYLDNENGDYYLNGRRKPIQQLNALSPPRLLAFNESFNDIKVLTDDYQHIKRQLNNSTVTRQRNTKQQQQRANYDNSRYSARRIQNNTFRERAFDKYSPSSSSNNNKAYRYLPSY